MKDSEIRIAIAEACGWSDLHFRGGIAKARSLVGRKVGYTFKMPRRTPEYLNDLNAMHEAEKVLTLDQQLRWPENLRQAVHPFYNHGEVCWDVYRATARQRAEAFLRTIGKWK